MSSLNCAPKGNAGHRVVALEVQGLGKHSPRRIAILVIRAVEKGERSRHRGRPLGARHLAGKIGERPGSGAQNVERILTGRRRAETAGQDLGVAQPIAVHSAQCRKRKIVDRGRNGAQHLVAFVAEEVGFAESPERGGKEIGAVGKERLGRDVGGDEQEPHQSEDVSDAAGDFIVLSTPRIPLCSAAISGRSLPDKDGANDVLAENVRQDPNRVRDDQPAHAMTDERERDAPAM